MTIHWTKEPHPRLTGSRPLDAHKVQAPCIVRKPDQGFRLFYTGIGPQKPYPHCQGYILSATSEDGLHFTPEPGIRLAPQPSIPHFSLRAITPSLTLLPDHRWRMYFEARGPAHLPTVICSALSDDQLHWQLEPGIRLQTPGGVGGPRYSPLSDGTGRLYCFESLYPPPGIGRAPRISSRIISARTTDGLIWHRGSLVLEGAGYDSSDLDAIHAEDMSLIPLDDNRLRLYYAACNKTGQWSIASAISNRVQNVSLD